ncbi:Xaa-Pro dipeptidase [Thermoactinomyces sp. DSM 45891]|uniref:M24 family metallopeptidase n=1 Tax=Thermoactinomyces sp. DSM 45891 TaxID=1761907 RepID=UPI00091DD5CF|nr:Xaa-Pro peptidase family protein [Thermoactinomyces sp. DSM 45891]SFX54114.1 Xaa-Pro dipeptidase [Thermoactinomyces sp. DSM 45891]
MNLRIGKLQSWLQEQHIDFAFISHSRNIYYLTGFDSEPHERLLGLLIPPLHDPLLICPKLDQAAAQQSGWSGEIISYDDTQDPWFILQDSLSEKSFARPDMKVAIEMDSIPYSRALRVQSLGAEIAFTDIEKQMNLMRQVKDDQELQILKEAAKLADLGVEIGVKALQVGITETEVVAKIEYELKKQGIQGMSFDTMVLFGEKSALPHGTPGDRKLKKGDLVLFDLGVVWQGYCSDITRTIAFGSITPEQERIYQTVLEAELTAINRVKAGVPLGEIDRAARDVIRQAGYGDYFPHRIGHGLGMSVHEFPSITETNQDLLVEGFVFTIEPGIYLPNVGGVRIEDDIVVGADGPVILTGFPKELLLVEE